MLGEIGQAVTFVAFFVASKVGKTGLTVTVDVFEGTTQIVTGGSASAIGGGLYYYTLAAGSVDAAANYTAVFKTTDGTVDQQHIPALWAVGKDWVTRLYKFTKGIIYGAATSNGTVSSAVLPPLAANHGYVGGTLVWLTGNASNIGVPRVIASQAFGDIVTPDYDWPAAPQSGDEFLWLPWALPKRDSSLRVTPTSAGGSTQNLSVEQTEVRQ